MINLLVKVSLQYKNIITLQYKSKYWITFYMILFIAQPCTHTIKTKSYETK